MSIGTITQEIKKAVHQNAASWTTLNKVYYTNATQGTAFPYSVFYLINDAENGSSTGDKFYDVKLQFNVYSASTDNGDSVETILNEIENNIKNLSVSGYTIQRIKRDFKVPPIYRDKIWQGVLQFNIHIG